MKKFFYTALATCFTLPITAQVTFQRLYDVVQDSTHILTDGIATRGDGFATIGNNVVLEGQAGIIHRAIFTTYDGKGEIQLAKDIYLADSTRLLSTSELVQVEDGSFIFSANLDELDLSSCVVALDGATAEPLWSRRMADEFQLKVSLATMPGNEVIAGSTNLQEGISIWLSRINGADGIDVWAKEYIALDENSDAVPADLFDLYVSQIDSSIYMTGQSVVGGTTLGYHTTKVGREGNVMWSRHIESAPAGLNFQPLGVTEATDTSVYVTGRIAFNNGATVINNLFVTKYDKEGEVSWVKTLTAGNSTFSNGNDIVAFGDNLVLSTLGTENGLETIAGLMEIDTAGSIVNSQVYRDSMTFFTLAGGLDTTSDGGIALFNTRFEQALDLVSDIVKTGTDLTTPCSNPDVGLLEDVPFRSEVLGWIGNDFVDSDTLETDINNANYYDVPTISPSPDQWCPNEVIIDTLDATPSPLPDGIITYEWMGPGVDGNTNPFVVGMEEGEYMVTVTINDRHCYTLCDTVNISRLPEPNVSIGQDLSQFCIDGTIGLIGQINGVEPLESIEWSTNETDPSIVVDTEGTYSITIVDACMEQASASTNVVIPEIESLALEAIVDDCEEFSALLIANTNGGGQVGLDFEWRDANNNIIEGENGNELLVTEPGTYTVSVSLCGETMTETITLESNPLTINSVTIEQDIITNDCEDYEARLTATADIDSDQIEYVWNTGDVGSVLFIDSIATYTVTATLCGVSVTEEFEVPTPSDDISFPKVFFPRGEDVLNRTFGPSNPCGRDITNYSLKIYNRWGNEVFVSDDVNVEWNGRHNDKDSASAVYVWVAEYSVGTNTEIISEEGDVTLLR